jgi:hypothetical protein
MELLSDSMEVLGVFEELGQPALGGGFGGCS